MAVLSVDLAFKDYADIGAVILEQSEGAIRCRQMGHQLTGVPAAEQLAECLNNFCRREHIRLILLDGPQAWKAADNDAVHCRWCERELNTPAKTGEPFSVKPAAYTHFVKFSIDCYDSLAKLGWQRLPRVGSPLGESHKWLVESFPLSAWRQLGLTPLPSKAKYRPQDITVGVEQLRRLVPLELGFEPSHDELQAIVAGLSGLAIERGDWQSCVVSGRPPVFENNYWREGYIVSCLATATHRWLGNDGVPAQLHHQDSAGEQHGAAPMDGLASLTRDDMA
jgi:hypothetical protein